MVVATRRNRGVKGRFWPVLVDFDLLELEVFAIFTVGDVSVLFTHAAVLLSAVATYTPMVRIFWYFKRYNFVTYTTPKVFGHVCRPLCSATFTNPFDHNITSNNVRVGSSTSCRKCHPVKTLHLL